MTTPAGTAVDIAAAYSGERCKFHPACCEQEDTTCPGCGAQAVRTLTFRAPADLADQRVPLCADHESHALECLLEETIRQRSQAN